MMNIFNDQASKMSFLQFESPILPLKEITTRLVLKILIDRINRFFLCKKKMKSEFFDVLFTNVVICNKICGCLRSSEIFKWITISESARRGVQELWERDLEQAVRIYKILNIDSIVPTIFLISEIKSMKEAKILRDDVIDFFQNIFLKVLQHHYGSEQKDLFARAMRCSNQIMEEVHNMHTVTYWAKCSENMPFFYQFNRCFQPLYANNWFLIAKRICRKRALQLDQQKNVFLQIFLPDTLNFRKQINFESYVKERHCDFRNNVFLAPSHTTSWSYTSRRPGFVNLLIEEKQKILHLLQQDTAHYYTSKWTDVVYALPEKVQKFLYLLQQDTACYLNQMGHVIFFYRASDSGGVCRNQMMLDFFKRASFLYNFVQTQVELNRFLIKRKDECQHCVVNIYWYRIMRIPRKECMKFLPEEIIGDREEMCICHLECDDFIPVSRCARNSTCNSYIKDNLRHPIELMTQYSEKEFDLSLELEIQSTVGLYEFFAKWRYSIV